MDYILPKYFYSLKMKLGKILQIEISRLKNILIYCGILNIICHIYHIDIFIGI